VKFKECRHCGTTTLAIGNTFTIKGREFNREAPGALVWKTAEGWRFWLGEEVKPGVWTMGCDAGGGELFAFGIYDEPAEVVAAFERMVAK
jgi:hypothetical protein